MLNKLRFSAGMLLAVASGIAFTYAYMETGIAADGHYYLYWQPVIASVGLFIGALFCVKETKWR
jgi:hypothetical protein